LRRLDLLPQQSRVAGEADELPRCQEIDHARPRIGRPQGRALAGLAGASEEARSPGAAGVGVAARAFVSDYHAYPRRSRGAWPRAPSSQPRVPAWRPSASWMISRANATAGETFAAPV